jgi:hypothetical protein
MWKNIEEWVRPQRAILEGNIATMVALTPL